MIHAPSWDASSVPGSLVVPVTSTETFERVYCSVDDVAETLPSSNKEQQGRQWRKSWRSHGSGLTATPIAELMEEVETKRLQEAIRESERVRAQIAARRERAAHGGTQVEEEARDGPTQLWVDKYKPRRVIELLNDEGVTRQMLHWVLSWNPIVFNKPAPK